MDILGDIVDYLGLIGTSAVAAGGFFGIKSTKSGGRTKKFVLKVKICHRIV